MKKSITHTDQKNLSDLIAGRVAGWILKYQELLTKILSGKTNQWSLKQQYIFLCMICIILGGGSIVAIIQSFTALPQERDRNTGVISTTVKILPKEKTALITQAEFEAAKQYKTEHPDLLHELPDLYERLSSIEEAYYSQKNK